MDHNESIEMQYPDSAFEILGPCQICGTPYGQDVFYHVNGNLEGIDSVCDECESWFVRLMTEG